MAQEQTCGPDVLGQAARGSIVFPTSTLAPVQHRLQLQPFARIGSVIDRRFRAPILCHILLRLATSEAL